MLSIHVPLDSGEEIRQNEPSVASRACRLGRFGLTDDLTEDV
jgi:hypothetical protein